MSTCDPKSIFTQLFNLISVKKKSTLFVLSFWHKLLLIFIEVVSGVNENRVRSPGAPFIKANPLTLGCNEGKKGFNSKALNNGECAAYAGKKSRTPCLLIGFKG